MAWGTPNPPDELAQHVSKNPFRTKFSFECSESYRVSNYLHDSNSIFRPARINSEWVSVGLVPVPRFQRGAGVFDQCGGIDYPEIFLLRNWILENFLTLWNFKAGKSTSGLRFDKEQPILRSPCTASKKLRLQSKLTIFWRRDRLWSEKISPTTICLMRWFEKTTSMFTSEKE